MSHLPNHKSHLGVAAQALYVEQSDIQAAHPLMSAENVRNHPAWDAAMILVGERHAKHDLVDLMGYLISRQGTS